MNISGLKSFPILSLSTTTDGIARGNVNLNYYSNYTETNLHFTCVSVKLKKRAQLKIIGYFLDFLPSGNMQSRLIKAPCNQLSSGKGVHLPLMPRFRH